MKRILVLIPLASLLSYCGTPRSGSSASNRVTRTTSAGATDPTDSVIVTGIQALPILGRSEAGIRADLEGIWILQSISGTPIAEKSSIDTSVLNRAAAIENRRDSVTITETINGQTKITTEVNIERPLVHEKKITPPQGSNYHIPEKPRLSFYGSNETFTGFTGCNKISGRYAVASPSSISFNNASPSTKMVCLGDYDETAFVNALKRVTSFKNNNGQLQLMEGETILLAFTRK